MRSLGPMVLAAVLALSAQSAETPLIRAARQGNIKQVRTLLATGADINHSTREGTALEIAEREGHTAVVALLRQAGARTSGRSVGDKVCVRPWRGDGYCGTVESIDRNDYRLDVTEIVGCRESCTAMPYCSAGRPVGGSGLKAGDTIVVPASCLTHTGMPK